jgi:predicted acylesterase/phospholipase RssA
MGALRALKEVNPTLDFPDGIYGCSAGCLFALAAAFRIDLDVLEEAYHKYFGIDTFLPHTTFENFQRIFETKGIMSTDAIVNQIVDAFLFAGVDIRDKTMDDAPQKLSFLSSDMTAQRPALLTGKVPIVNAFACSICVPFVFRPEILYGHVHLDGGVFTRCMADVVSPETLVVHVSGIGRQITETSSLSDICTALYGGHRGQYFRKNVVRIAPPPINFLDEVTREQKMEMAKSGYLQTRAFLAKRLAEEHE